MPDPMSLDAAFPVTSMQLIELFRSTRPRVVALRDVARPLAQRRGTETVSAEIDADARLLLETTRTIVARQRGARALLTLAGPPDWATLLTKLEFALVALAAFQDKFSDYDERYGAVVWRDEIWLDFHLHGVESDSDDNDLHES